MNCFRQLAKSLLALTSLFLGLLIFVLAAPSGNLLKRDSVNSYRGGAGPCYEIESTVCNYNANPCSSQTCVQGAGDRVYCKDVNDNVKHEILGTGQTKTRCKEKAGNGINCSHDFTNLVTCTNKRNCKSSDGQNECVFDTATSTYFCQSDPTNPPTPFGQAATAVNNGPCTAP